MRLIVSWVLTVFVGMCASFVSENRTLSETEVQSIRGDCDFEASTTTYEKSFQKLLSRQKRWFVFPKGANIGFTIALLKAILDGRPHGLRTINEVTISYDVPPWVEGWKAINIWGVTPTSPRPATSPKPAPLHWADYHPTKYVWNYPHAPVYSKNRRKGQQLISNQIPVQRRKSFFHDRYFPVNHDHHREYRERRQIYQKLEYLVERLGISGKACVLRVICEVNNSLLPEGMSFIQDVARIIFSLPVHQAIDDEYMDGARRQPMDCAREFASTCPFNPIALFLGKTQGPLEKWRKRRR